MLLVVMCPQSPPSLIQRRNCRHMCWPTFIPRCCRVHGFTLHIIENDLINSAQRKSPRDDLKHFEPGDVDPLHMLIGHMAMAHSKVSAQDQATEILHSRPHGC